MPSESRRQVFRAYEPGTAASERDAFCLRCGGRCFREQLGGRRRPVCGWCGFVHYQNPCTGVAIVIRRSELVLLGCHRSEARNPGWAFPAGFVEFDEDFLSAARREAREETGLDVTVTGILNVASNQLTEELHVLVVAVAAVATGGEARAGNDLVELRWVNPGRPGVPLAYEADAELLRMLATGPLPWLPVDRRFADGQTLRDKGKV